MKTLKLPLILLFTLVLAVFSTSAQDGAKIMASDGSIAYMEFKAGVKADNGASVLAKSLNASENDKFERVKSEGDELGMVHDQYQQFHKGVKVEFGTYKVHSKGGEVVSISGEFSKLNNLNTKPSLNEKAALAKAIASVGASKYMWESDASLMPKGELVIVYGKLAYKFDIYAEAPLSRADIYVSAENGAVVFSNAIIKHANAVGTASTRYSGSRSIGTGTTTGGYNLVDLTRGSGISTFNSKTTKTYPTTHFVDADNSWTEYANTAKDNAALDAHWGAQQTYDYFLAKHARNSYNNAGAAIKSYVHYDVAYDNAFWNGSVMTYGDGSGTNFDALTSIDVAGHEIGHAVCTFTANLVYSNESGAMNEGFSDIWGACIEAYARNSNVANTATWLIGEDIERRAGHASLRSMSNPNVEGQPDTYLGTSWYSGTGDNGGVHYNSGVLNHWFYRLVVGGSGTNDKGTAFNVTPIVGGLDAAAKIAYRTESVYLTSSSTYSIFASKVVIAATDLYGAGSSQVVAVQAALTAVGLAAGTGGGGTVTPVCATTTGISVAKAAWAYYTITVPVGTASLTVTTTGANGDADLYIRSGSTNPTTSAYTVRSWATGSNETATQTSPVSGTWKIGVYGYAAATSITLKSCTTASAMALNGSPVSSSLMFDSQAQGEEAITVYPNPATDMVKVSLGFEVSESTKVSIVSVTGQEMKSVSASELANGIDVSSLPKGVYLVNAHDGKSKQTAKFVKQ
jgi:bacillolysin